MRFLSFYSQCARVIALLALSGCGDEREQPALSCVANLSTECSPLFDPPVYSILFDQILKPSCAQGKGTCHTPDAAKGGIVMENADDTYARLLGEIDGRVRVIPGDPACSMLVERLEASSPDVRMPPGPTPLSAAARCDVVLWIAQGANR